MQVDDRKLSVDLKYKLYESSVQCHESDIDFINDQFEIEFNKRPFSLREDFGGTAAMACDWVKQGPSYNAWAVDLDPEPIKYGLENHYIKLNAQEKARMEYVEGNVLDDFSFRSDIIVAFNFSYFIFKKRAQLLDYFKKVKQGLKDEGAFFIDLFGGTQAYEPLEEETEHDNHSYFWDLDKFNPLTGECLYKIHFKLKENNKKYRDVFTYDWRMWNPNELKEILEEAGFSRVKLFWEGEDDDGDGDGNFEEATLAVENCDSWVIYIMAVS